MRASVATSQQLQRLSATLCRSVEASSTRRQYTALQHQQQQQQQLLLGRRCLRRVERRL